MAKWRNGEMHSSRPVPAIQAAHEVIQDGGEMPKWLNGEMAKWRNAFRHTCARDIGSP
jgi:hypothetical protein